MKRNALFQKLRLVSPILFLLLGGIMIGFWFLSYFYNFAIQISAKNSSPTFGAFLSLEYQAGLCIFEFSWVGEGLPTQLKFGVPIEPYSVREGEEPIDNPPGIPFTYRPTLGMMLSLNKFDWDQSGNWIDHSIQARMRLPVALGLYLPILTAAIFLLLRNRRKPNH